MTELKLPTAPFGIDGIYQLIPHRSPFLLVDKILEYTPGESIVGLKNISMTEPALTGHFPGQPVFPGVLQVESLAQTCAVFGRLTEPLIEGCLLTEISEARFRRLVIPGDSLKLNVRLEKRRRHFLWFDCQATVDDQVAVTLKISAKLGI